MARPQTLAFRHSGTFAVQWQPDGGILVRETLLAGGENSFLFTDGRRYFSALRAADRVTDAFFATAGQIFQDEFLTLPEVERASVAFPIVTARITVAGSIAVRSKLIIDGEAEARSRITTLAGTTRSVRVTIPIADIPGEPYPVACVIAGAGGREIEGHSDPGCTMSWTGCSCVVACCQHIVQDQFGRCWNEVCGWSWMFMHCGCLRGRRVTCP